MRTLRALFSYLMLGLALACSGGGGGGSTMPAPAITVTVTPVTFSLAPNGTQIFTASVANSANQTVTWMVDGTASGSITQAGLYTAPSAPGGPFIVRATSQADATKSGTAVITVTAPPVVSITINPSAPTLAASGSVQLSASITGSSNPNATWTVIPGSATGTIPAGPSALATFTAGPTPGTCQVRAVSVDGNVTATATVTVTTSTGLTISPPVLSIAPGTTQTFGAFLNGLPTSAVNWTLQEGAVAGAISAAGLYTAGTTVGTYHVQATTTAGPALTATAQVTVATTISIQILPGTLTLSGGDTGNLNAQLDPTGILRDVTWAIQEGSAGGSYSTDNGYMVYSPPIVAIPTTFHVTVTSVADPTKSSTAVITVNPPPAGGAAFTAAPQSMASRRQQFTATALADGRIFICGGFYDAPSNTPFAEPQELFDPATRSFAAVTSTMIHDRSYHTATLMNNGKVLITGGATGYEDPNRASAETFDSATGLFTATQNLMSVIRGAGHQAALLTTGPNAGKILVMGGAGYFYTTDATSSADLYDPTSNSFTPLATGMNDARSGFTATKLQDGKILITGGVKNSTERQLATAELFDPVAMTFTRTTGNLATARFWHTATLLNNGKVIITGGNGAFDAHTEIAELFNPSSGTFTQVPGPMAVARYYHSATLTSDGRVLVVGGKDVNSYVYRTCGSAEIYDPVANTWSSVGRMNTAREEHAAILLVSGPSANKVLVLGGSNGNAKNSAEISN